MEPSGIISLVVVGLVIGALGRLVVPGRQPIGCLFTLLLGLLGATLGLVLGEALDVGWLVTFFFQVLLAAILVAIVGRTIP